MTGIQRLPLSEMAMKMCSAGMDMVISVIGGTSQYNVLWIRSYPHWTKLALDEITRNMIDFNLVPRACYPPGRGTKPETLPLITNQKEINTIF